MTRHLTGAEAEQAARLVRVQVVMAALQDRLQAAAREGRRGDLRLTKEEADELTDAAGGGPEG